MAKIENALFLAFGIAIAYLPCETLCIWSFPRFLGSLSFVGLCVSSFRPVLVTLTFLGLFGFVCSAIWNWKNKESSSIGNLIVCIWFLFWLSMSIQLAQKLRQEAFVRASQVGDPIVEALARYKRTKGQYPESLNQLRPDYLTEIPYTGMIGYPKFVYNKDRHDVATVPGEYELRIDCPSGAINFDRFIYWPTEKYPEQLQGNRVERIRRWAYVHE